MFRLIATIAIIGGLAFGIDAQASDLCDRNKEKLIQSFEGYNGDNGYEFKFESRAELYSTTANRFIWCIENKSSYNLIQFRWGSESNDKKYFSSMIEPGFAIPTIATDPSEILSDARTIKFKLPYIRSWEEIKRETLFYKKLGTNNLVLPPSNIILAQADAFEIYKGGSGIIDISRMTSDLNALNNILAISKRIPFYFSSIVTLPINPTALRAILSEKYEKYNNSDFARFRLTLNNYLDIRNDRPSSSVELSMSGITQEDSVRLESASKLGLAVHIAPLTTDQISTFPKELSLRYGVEPKFDKLVFQQSLSSVTQVSALLSVRADGDIALFTMPLKIFVSGESR